MRASEKRVDRHYDAFSPGPSQFTSQKFDGIVPAGSKEPTRRTLCVSWGYARRVKTWIAEPTPSPPCRPCLVPRFWDRGVRPGGGHRRHTPVPEWAERWTRSPRLLTVNQTVGTIGKLCLFLLQVLRAFVHVPRPPASRPPFPILFYLYRDKHTGVGLINVGLGCRDAHDSRPPTAPLQPLTQ